MNEGSSPRTRGAQINEMFGTDVWGIIPADAGSTSAGAWTAQEPSDHPRGRGEHLLRAVGCPNRNGSSPRTRGALLCIQGCIRRSGIIPADAGSTWQSGSGPHGYGDHPRGRGEHGTRRMRSRWVLGSSPRTRGAHTTVDLLYAADGIIPADAGSTVKRRCRLIWMWDHPRGRGEHNGAASTKAAKEGSSPRTRGARVRACRGRGRPGIIPADAGSTE